MSWGSYYHRWKLKFQVFRIVVIIYQETIQKHNAQCQLWLLYDEVLFPCFRSVLSLAFFNLWLLITFTINWTSIRLFLLLKQRRYPLHKTSQHNILVELRRLASEYLSSLEIIINLLWNVKLFSPVWKRCFKSDTRFPFNDFGGQKCVCADGDTFKVWRKYIQKQKQQQFKTYSNTSYYWYGSHFVRISRYGCSSFFFSAQLGLLKDKAILRTRRQRVFLK